MLSKSSIRLLCSISGCLGRHRSRGLCGKHYRHAREAKNLPPLLTDVQRFWARVNKNGPLWNGTPCWEWDHPDVHGYGVIWWHQRSMKAHRLAYELLVGPIPGGLTLDHLCRNTTCVNPDHLEPVTLRVNILRGESPFARNARKTHCLEGHPFTQNNTRFFFRLPKRGRPGGLGRYCRTCGNARERRRSALQKALT